MKMITQIRLLFAMGETLVALEDNDRFYSKGDPFILTGWYTNSLGYMQLRFEGRRGSFNPKHFKPLRSMPEGFVPNAVTSLNSAML